MYTQLQKGGGTLWCRQKFMCTKRLWLWTIYSNWTNDMRWCS